MPVLGEQRQLDHRIGQRRAVRSAGVQRAAHVRRRTLNGSERRPAAPAARRWYRPPRRPRLPRRPHPARHSATSARSSSSRPHTASPNAARQRATCASRSVGIAARPEAQMHPVVVGVDPGLTPSPGSSSRSPTISASADSPIPKVFTVRDRQRPQRERARRAEGRTCSSHMRRISDGTPGISTTTRPSRSTHQPGAEPMGLGSASADGIAQRLAQVGLGHRAEGREALPQLRLEQRGPATSASPSASARPSRVRSSWVGPRPPVATTSGARRAPRRRHAAIAARSSGSVRMPRSGIPRRASDDPRKAALVSTVSPASSSEPMLSSSARAVARPRPSV